jgi:hypothetical protein
VADLAGCDHHTVRRGPKTREVDGIGRIIHIGPIEVDHVRRDIQQILEGGQAAFKARERRYQNDLSRYHEALGQTRERTQLKKSPQYGQSGFAGSRSVNVWICRGVLE